MILSTLTKLLASIGLSERVAKMLAPLALLLAVLALLASLWGAWAAFDWFNDRQAVNADRTKREAIEARAALEAERRANRGGEARDAARDQDHQTTEDELEEIEDADPETARAPAGRGTRAVADRLRKPASGRH